MTLLAKLIEKQPNLTNWSELFISTLDIIVITINIKLIIILFLCPQSLTYIFSFFLIRHVNGRDMYIFFQRN